MRTRALLSYRERKTMFIASATRAAHRRQYRGQTVSSASAQSNCFEWEINTGFGLDFGADGNLYVVSGGSNVVVKLDPLSGASLGNFVTSGSGGLNGAIGVEFGPDGSLYVASLNTDIIERYNGVTGAPLGDFVSAGSGGLDAPNFFTFAVPEPTGAALLLIGAAVPLLRRPAGSSVENNFHRRQRGDVNLENRNSGNPAEWRKDRASETD